MSEVQYRSLEVRPAVCNPRATGSRTHTGVGGSSERRLCLQSSPVLPFTVRWESPWTIAASPNPTQGSHRSAHTAADWRMIARQVGGVPELVAGRGKKPPKRFCPTVSDETEVGSAQPNAPRDLRTAV